ncbi:MAG: FtsW/RodA/SpoVE family cell cycle protein [Lachnospiraceae bacterium]|nr:FtsW/RodA/SpoVE family cell cycle protein [Lachnospiraceae bacterium]
MFRFQLYSRRNFSYQLILCVLILSGIGLLVLNSALANDSARDETMMKQVVGIAVGFAIMMFLTFVDYHFLLRLSPLIYAGGVLLLVLVLSPLGSSSGTGAQRWLNLGVQIQPSEFFKICLILFFAWFYWKNESRINRPVVVFGGLLLAVAPALLVLREPDLSTTLVIAFIFIVILYSAGISYKWIFLAVAILIPVCISGVLLIIRYQDYLYENVYQIRRILSWLYPDKYAASGNTTQQDNSVLAIASGQLFGKGLNNTSFESVKNGNFLSEEDCDFIFAVIGEELGFVGSAVVVGLFAVLVFLCLRIAARARDKAGQLICVGMASLIAFQSFVNIGVATELLPNTGLPLPFISAGLSSLLSLYIGMGLVMNVALQRTERKDSDW